MTVAGGLSLDDLIGLRSLSRDELRGRFGDLNVAEGVAYEGLAGVDRLDIGHPRMHAFFRGDDQVMLYVPRKTLAEADPDEIEAQLGEPEGDLRSRTGKRARVKVWPDRGVALAREDDTAQILEVFQPTTLDRYRAEIYREPAPFIR